MSKGFVLLGDKTTHEGQVLSASSTMIVNGKKVALIGDKVSWRSLAGVSEQPALEPGAHAVGFY